MPENGSPRYLLFVGENCYPSGGWEDFDSAHDEMELAICEGLRSDGDWWHVVDMESLEVVAHQPSGWEPQWRIDRAKEDPSRWGVLINATSRKIIRGELPSWTDPSMELEILKLTRAGGADH